MTRVLLVVVFTPLTLATGAAIGLGVYVVDEPFLACDRQRPAIEARVDRLVEDVLELMLSNVGPSGCDSSDVLTAFGQPAASLRDLDRALVEHGCRRIPDPDLTDTAWDRTDERLTISYFAADDLGLGGVNIVGY